MNIPNFKNEDGHYVKHVTRGQKRDWTMSGNVWNAMRARCKPEGCVQTTFTNYIGCQLSDEFKSFDTFVGWHEQQIGFGRNGYDLDKDLLILGNKIYGPNTCVLIPCQLNSFLTINTRPGIYPTGVQITPFGRYKVQMRVNGKNVYIGSFKTPQEASAAYKTAKEAEARRWATRLEAGEFPVDSRVIERMRVWTP